jgi:hypothetical protein
MDVQPEERLVVGYGRLAEFLTSNGFPTSKSTISKYCSPAVDIGPPVAAYWGKLAAFRPSEVLTWAKARLKPAALRRVAREGVVPPDRPAPAAPQTRTRLATPVNAAEVTAK